MHEILEFDQSTCVKFPCKLLIRPLFRESLKISKIEYSVNLFRQNPKINKANEEEIPSLVK